MSRLTPAFNNYRRNPAVLGGMALIVMATLTACGSSTDTNSTVNPTSSASATMSSTATASTSAKTSESASTTTTASGAAAAQTPASRGPAIVATTNVYASVARAIAGDSSEVSAILEDPAADPHDFEVTPADKLKMSKAAVVIVNGGGYDEWANTVLNSLDPKPVVIDAFKLSDHAGDADGSHEDEADDHAHDHGAVNEHVFYDVESMDDLAKQISAELTKAAPANKSVYEANLKAFEQRIDALEKQIDGITEGSFNYIATEPVAGYLLEEAGGKNVTPPAFSAAIESGNDPSVAIIKSVNDLITSKQAKVLVYNAQTSDSVTDKLKDLAAQNGLGVVAVSETLPEGTDTYTDWMDANVTALATAVKKG